MKLQEKKKSKKLHRTNQGSSFLRRSFTNTENVKQTKSCLEEKDNLSILNIFSSRIEPTTFLSIASELSERSNETS